MRLLDIFVPNQHVKTVARVMVSLLTLCAAHHVFDTHSRQLNTKKLVFVATPLSAHY
jgi:hypothetical protein